MALDSVGLELAAIQERLAQVETYFHLDELQQRVSELETQSTQPGFWDDVNTARVVMSDLARAKSSVGKLQDARTLAEEAQMAYELASESDEAEWYDEAQGLIGKLTKVLDDLELASWFTGEFDAGDAIVTITPGQGGLEAQDWVSMLLRMYQRFAERHNWKLTINDAPVGEAIGLDRATVTIAGENVYGMMRSEQGVHRLVRISPTDAKKRRQTTFAGVEVLPVLPDDVEVDINPADLRIDVYHASGPGGQGVNTTDSAVRVTHLPTGIVVTCQNERSQLQNKAVCMNILRSKLYELELAKREETLDELRGPKHEIGFGNQIRSYVLYPYQMVKDLRTGVETGNVSSVLDDGNLDDFIVGYHRWVVGGRKDLGLSAED